MTTVRLALNRMSTAEKIQLCRRVADLMENNPHFPSPPFSYDDLRDSANYTEEYSNQAASALTAAKAKQGDADSSEAEMDTRLTAVGRYVSGVSNGNATVILSSGLGISEEAMGPELLPAPANLRAELLDASGHIGLKWSSIRKAYSYQVQYRPVGSQGEWSPAASVTKAKAVVKGLPSGSKNEFRVCAVSPAGQSEWSEVIKKVVQ